ncbi:hypothetical protein ABG768_000664, partial [Culter alburnus]
MNSTDFFFFFFFLSLCHDDILYVTMALGYPVELQYRCCSGLCNPSPTSSPFCVGMTNWICPSIKMPQWLVLLPLLLILFVQSLPLPEARIGDPRLGNETELTPLSQLICQPVCDFVHNDKLVKG